MKEIKELAKTAPEGQVYKIKGNYITYNKATGKVVLYNPKKNK